MTQPALAPHAETSALPFPIRLRSTKSKRGMDARSLRPGDWLIVEGRRATILQNYAKVRRVEVDFGWGMRSVHNWDSFLHIAIYVGKGQRRAFWPLLPRFLRKVVCEYSKP